ncbi:MAG: hypothetical protein ACRD27_03745 [Terracidiphilus sp.]
MKRITAVSGFERRERLAVCIHPTPERETLGLKHGHRIHATRRGQKACKESAQTGGGPSSFPHRSTQVQALLVGPRFDAPTRWQ